jgi:glycosyltransferase involved in cell wall biosynthesis
VRIAIFTESYVPVVNGVASAVQWLAGALREEHEVVIYAPRFPGHEDRDGGVVRLPSFPAPGQTGYPLASPLLPGEFRRFAARRFDAVHTQSPFTLGQVGMRWARRAGIPVVTTYHTLYVEYAHYAGWIPAGMSRPWLRWVSRNYCNACDQVAVPTAPIRAVLQEYGVRTPIRVIPTGLPARPATSADAGPDPRGAFGIPSEAELVLYAGRLAREKNLELLFAAFARVAAARPRAHLLVAGGGPMEAEARAMAAVEGVADRVTFAGFLPQERLWPCYRAASAFAFTSLTDTQGLVIVEAKSVGLPVVSVDAYGPSTVVRDGIDGLLVPNDAGAFAGAIARLLSDPQERDRMSAAALEDSRRFRIESTAAAYLQLYAEAMRQPAGAPAVARG